MTSLLAVAVLLSTQAVDGQGPLAKVPDPLAKAQQAMLGGARLPWVLHVTGSIARSEQDAGERFVLEWEPYRRLDVLGHHSSAAETMIQAVKSLVGVVRVRVEKNGTQIRYVWERSNWSGSERFSLDVDPPTGLVYRSRYDEWELRPPNRRSRPTITAEFSDFKTVGTMRLPHRIRLARGNETEHWTIDQIEIVPLP